MNAALMVNGPEPAKTVHNLKSCMRNFILMQETKPGCYKENKPKLSYDKYFES
ncbi:Hypothetical protein GbCGDNIH9_8498 [Granulibacter bethesdensis]|uniref:Uncharacterized protein n=1 Tax=Granulibacter bethesdensis TaxID=364410 RepID=A0AAC9KCH0_9PROT|nr:Hypothetical protein GbCGDNIH9_8498 [Granulibacter bethesdensis]APH61997.1 Hypothetical protein GbCGDNIH8_8498 [Granulibacter bethesdensis]